MLSMPLLPIVLFGACFVSGFRQRQESDTVPAVISDRIRIAKSTTRKKLKEVEAREAEVKERTVDAQTRADQKAKFESEQEAAAKEAAARLTELQKQEVKTVAAMAAVFASNETYQIALKHAEQTKTVHAGAVDEFTNMQEYVTAEKENLRKQLTKETQAVTEAARAKREADIHVADLHIAYKAAETHENSEVQALVEAEKKTAQATKLALEKAASVENACRETEAARNALADANADLHNAEKDVKKKRDMKGYLWGLYDRIEEFYDATSVLVKAMRSSEDECSQKAHECLVSDGPGGGRVELKKVLEGYNSMVVGFRTIKELYHDVYQDIKEARKEVNTNAMAQVILVCDPYKELEEVGNSAAFNSKCGAGLFPAVGLIKLRMDGDPTPAQIEPAMAEKKPVQIEPAMAEKEVGGRFQSSCAVYSKYQDVNFAGVSEGGTSDLIACTIPGDIRTNEHERHKCFEECCSNTECVGLTLHPWGTMLKKDFAHPVARSGFETYAVRR